MNSKNASAQKKSQPPKSGKELKVLLSKEPEEFKARVGVEFRRSGMLPNMSESEQAIALLGLSGRPLY